MGFVMVSRSSENGKRVESNRQYPPHGQKSLRSNKPISGDEQKMCLTDIDFLLFRRPLIQTRKPRSSERLIISETALSTPVSTLCPWRFSGISRDCYLYMRPKTHFYDLNIQSTLSNNYADGRLIASVEVWNETIEDKSKYQAELSVYYKDKLLYQEKKNTTALKRAFGKTELQFQADFPQVKAWSDKVT